MSTMKQIAAVIIAGALIGVLIAMPARAQTVGLHIGSHHFPSQAGQNNANLGGYARFDSGLTFGGYRNTIHRNSWYGGYSAEYGLFSATVGVVSGYQRKGGIGHTRGALGPLAALSVKGPEVFGVAPRLTYVPGHLVKSPDVLHFSMEKPFK